MSVARWPQEGRIAVYLVGGAVRDRLLGRTPREYDFAFDADGETFLRLHPRARRVGRSVSVILLDGQEYMPLQGTLEEDLRRRDLTVNALAEDREGRLYAHPEALSDIAGCVLRPASPTSFADDPVRVFRLARMACELPSFTVHDEAVAQMRAVAASGRLEGIPAERVGREFMKALAAPRPSCWRGPLAEGGCLSPWFREVEAAEDIPAGPLNAVAGYDISRDPSVPNVAAKSFLLLDTEGRIETIIEKRVVSHVIAVGLYLFASTAMFEVAYHALESENREIYMSDVIAWLIRERGETFVPLMARAYEDWGTLAEWKALQKRSRTYFVDVDGVLMKNSGRYGKINWNNNAEMLEDNVAALRALQDAGAQIVVTTCRDEAFREPLEAMLRDCGLRPHAVVMGLNHAARVLINDFAPTNPYPSCLAISLPRNASLKEYLAD